MLGTSEQKIDVAYLAIGMYVYSLDRDWLGTPFPIEGFHIKTPKEIELLRQMCDYVIIDLRKSHLKFMVNSSHEQRPKERLRVREYVDQFTLVEEMPRAREAYEAATALTSKIIADISAGKQLSLEDVKEAVDPVVKSVLRNADAFLWITKLRKHDSYAYSHAINCSLLAAVFGRHMGFSEQVLGNLATGGLLLDVGKSVLPGELLTRPGPLEAEEFRQVQQHVAHGLRMLEESGINSADVLEMVRTHHERHDGSGYPARLVKNQIPLFGRIAAVIDSYDALTSQRAFRKALAPHQALQQMYRQRDKLYQGEIVEQLMQCLSVYPTGSLVELNTGEVAIVMAQNQARRLRPRVMVLTTADKQLNAQFTEVDLLAQTAADDGSVPIEIVGTLDPGAYGIDPAELFLD